MTLSTIGYVLIWIAMVRSLVAKQAQHRHVGTARRCDGSSGMSM